VRVGIVGAGIVGSATAAYLLRAGADVACFEAATPMSQRSAGSTRIFRLAHGAPALVDLAGRARSGYRRWGEEAGAELVDRTGVVVSGPEAEAWSRAMGAVGAECRLLDGLDLLGLHLPGPVLHDPAGGVLDADATGRYLTARTAGALIPGQVEHLEHHGDAARVRTAAGHRDFDAVVIAAGAGTAALAAQVGIGLPATTAHHVRFTFRLRDPAARPPCLLEGSLPLGTYQHRAAPGLWAVGVHLPDDEVAWHVGRDVATARAREATMRYVREHLAGVSGDPVDALYCSYPVGWGDGYVVVRAGRFLALHGDNLFKLAPVLGEILGEAALTGSTPVSHHA
jgi:sarcosine oxidase